MFVRVILLCVATAMICSALRTQRPEIATAVSLAAGVVALAMLWRAFALSSDGLDGFRALFRENDDLAATVVKAAGIAVLAELGAQLCADAGERALAGRIVLAARVAAIGLCAPMLSRMAELIRGVLA